MKAKIYVGVAGIDPSLFEGETQTLKQTFDAKASRTRWKTTPGPIYDKAAAEQPWQRLLALYGERLK